MRPTCSRNSPRPRGRWLLRQSLEKKHVCVNDIARQLGLQERTLHRRLRSEGTHFRQELKALRFELAKQLLMSTKQPLQEIAAVLGYLDTSAFIRAFKAWSGVIPAQWRAGRQAR